MIKTDNKNITAEEVEHPVFSVPEKAPQFPFLLRRTIEFLFTSLVCSLPIAILYATGIIPKTNDWALKFMGISFFAFILLSGYLLRAFYFSMGNKKVYFNVNLVAYGIFAVLNIIFLICFKDVELPSIYSFLFMPMKFANVILNMIAFTGNLKVQILAPIATHILMFFVIFAAPFEMYKFDKKRK